jgi:hypothetical protein
VILIDRDTRHLREDVGDGPLGAGRKVLDIFRPDAVHGRARRGYVGTAQALRLDDHRRQVAAHLAKDQIALLIRASGSRHEEQQYDACDCQRPHAMKPIRYE